jgi:hypothetical protein
MGCIPTSVLFGWKSKSPGLIPPGSHPLRNRAATAERPRHPQARSPVRPTGRWWSGAAHRDEGDEMWAPRRQVP